jgi:hypothetical protein
MNLTSPFSLEEHILTSLQLGTMPIVRLIEIIKTKRPKTTKQGVYLIIRKLKRQEIVVVHKKNISLSGVWISAMEEFFRKAEYATRNINSPNNTFLNLNLGEKIQYYFKNPVLTDAFWSHVFITLVETSSPQLPVLIYNPHEWFLLARTENEAGLFGKIAARGQKLALLCGNNTTLDKFVRKHFDRNMTFYETLEKPLFDKNNYYVNVIGDFVIEVWLDKKVCKEIDDYYTKTQNLGEIERQKLEHILSQKGKNKFVVSRNKRKAEAFRSKFKKYFFL